MYRNFSHFIAFSQHMNDFSTKINAISIKPNQLASTNSRIVKNTNHKPVAAPLPNLHRFIIIPQNAPHRILRSISSSRLKIRLIESCL